MGHSGYKLERQRNFALLREFATRHVQGESVWESPKREKVEGMGWVPPSKTQFRKTYDSTVTEKKPSLCRKKKLIPGKDPE